LLETAILLLFRAFAINGSAALGRKSPQTVVAAA
jgi:hypothetical protein